jgi:phosphoribosylformimino-5-aminoimidazole carboxamide ribotide isomerase
MRLIPAIDLRGGRCVRLLQGRFDRETVYGDDPTALLRHYAGLGAREIHVVDLDGARSGAAGNRALVAELIGDRRVAIQLGGGIRSQRSAVEWLELGARRVVIGSAAVEKPDEVRGWLRELGSDRVILAFDVRVDADGVPYAATQGWEQDTRHSLWDLVAGYTAAGLHHVLCTDVNRDGALSGPNVALYAEAVRRFPSIEWQASGGVSGAADLAALAQTGVAGVVSGRALLEHRLDAQEIAPYLPSA